MGRAVDQQWIFVLYDTMTKLGHVQLVDYRRADTLIKIIQKFSLSQNLPSEYYWAMKNAVQRVQSRCTMNDTVSERVGSFLTAHQHKIGHSVPYVVKIN